MNPTRKLFMLVLALAALAAFAVGCGGDDDEKKDDAAPAAQSTTEEAAPEEAGTIDEETLNAFINAINEDPTIICDPANVTAELLEGLGGEEACKEAAAEEDAGGELEVTDIEIDGDKATAVITDEDGPTDASFVQEGDELKLASSEPRE